jgi:hypothetical protein
MTMPKRVCQLPQSRGVGRHQIGTRYCGCSHSHLGSNRSEKGTTHRPGQRARSGGSRVQTAPRMERHRQLQPHMQKLLAQWKSPTAGNGILECHWESANRQSRIAQIILPQSRVNDVLTQLHGRLSGGHLDVNKTLNKVQQMYYWLQARNAVKKRCWQCDIFAASCGS